MTIRSQVVGLVMLLTTGCMASVYDKATHSWEGWIGTSKDDRVRDLGIPMRCHAFKTGGEACEWPIRWAADSVGAITIQFDTKGNACSWTYRDAYSDQRSRSQC
jgi:hypothetical protein